MSKRTNSGSYGSWAAGTSPEAAKDFLKKAMEDNPMGYTVALGLPDLRKKIAELYGDWYGLDVDWNRII